MKAWMLLLLLAVGCSRGGDKFEIYISNETGADLADFRLDYGGGAIAYQIFCKGCTFHESVQLKKRSPLAISYAGVPSAANDFTVDPSQAGGEIQVKLQPGGTANVRYLKFARTETSGDSGTNRRLAKRHFDALAIGMPEAEASQVMNMDPLPQAKYGWSKDFGFSLEDGCFSVEARIVAGEVVRVVMREPCMKQPQRIVEEKGISEAEYERQ